MLPATLTYIRDPLTLIAGWGSNSDFEAGSALYKRNFTSTLVFQDSGSKLAFVTFEEPQSAQKAVLYNMNAVVRDTPVSVTW